MASLHGGGILENLKGVVATGLELLRTRLELLGTDVELEGQRVREIAWLHLGAAFFFGLAVLFASALVVVALWDTHRVAAVAGVALLHLAIGAVLLSKARSRARSRPRPFDATLSELERDISQLRR